MAGELQSLTVTGTNCWTQTWDTVAGWVEAVVVEAVTASSTGDINVVFDPTLSALPEVTIVSLSSSAGDSTIHPRVQCQNTSGSNLTNDYTRIPLVDGKVQVRVTAANTNAMVRVVKLIWDSM